MEKLQMVIIKSTNQKGFIDKTRKEFGTWVYFLIDSNGKRIYNGNMSGWNESQLEFK